MATRGIIAVQRAGGFRGRYVHWDNYPNRMVDVLGNIAKRDGLTKMVTTLINDNASWSVIDDQQGTEDKGIGYSQKNMIEGYGVVHDDIDKNDPTSWFTENDTEFAWAEYIYVIRDTGLEVFKVEDREGGAFPVPMELYAWDTIGLVSDTPSR